MQIVGQHILKHSKDVFTRKVVLLYRGKCHNSKSKRWEPGAAVDKYENALNFNIKFGGQTGRHGLGYGKKKSLKNANLRERRQAISDLCKKESIESTIVGLHGLVRSGNMLKWENLESTHSNWNTQILGMSRSELGFTLNVQSLAAPSPSNLRRWGLNKGASCPLCSKPAATAMHILSSCFKALNQHRYTWRHDNCIRSILGDLKGRISQANRKPAQAIPIPHIMSSFVKKGKNKTLKPNVSKPCLLDLANDWKMVIDFDGSIPFPINEVPCTERPDIVIYSVTKRIVIWGELTVPREERILASAIKKKKKIHRSKNCSHSQRVDSL